MSAPPPALPLSVSCSFFLSCLYPSNQRRDKNNIDASAPGHEQTGRSLPIVDRKSVVLMLIFPACILHAVFYTCLGFAELVWKTTNQKRDVPVRKGFEKNPFSLIGYRPISSPAGGLRCVTYPMANCIGPLFNQTTDSLKGLQQASLLKISQSLTEPLTQKGFKWWYETKIKVLLNCRSQLWDLIHIFLGKVPPFGNHEDLSPYTWTFSSILNKLQYPAWLQRGPSAERGPLKCLRSSSGLSSIIQQAVWQLTAPPGRCLPLPVSDRLCMHNQVGRETIWAGNFYASQPSSNTGKRSERQHDVIQKMLRFDWRNQHK